MLYLAIIDRRLSLVVEGHQEMYGLVEVRREDAFDVAVGCEQQPLKRSEATRQPAERRRRSHNVAERGGRWGVPAVGRARGLHVRGLRELKELSENDLVDVALDAVAL